MTPSARKAPPQHVVGTPVIHPGKHVQPAACGPFSGAELAGRVHETDPQLAFMVAALERLAWVRS